MSTNEQTRIVILDQQKETRTLLEESLANKGYIILESTDNTFKALDILRTEKVDVLIMDVVLPHIDGIEFLKIATGYIKQGKPQIIVCSQIKEENIISTAKNNGASHYMFKPVDVNLLAEKIELLTNPSTSEKAKDTGNSIIETDAPADASTDDLTDEEIETYLEKRIVTILAELGVPGHVKGYHFIKYAITTVVKNPEAINSVTEIIYSAIAKSFGTPLARVESGIRHAIETAWDRGDIDAMNRFFGYSVVDGMGKPTNSEFIAMIADSLRLEDRRFRELSKKSS